MKSLFCSWQLLLGLGPALGSGCYTQKLFIGKKSSFKLHFVMKGKTKCLKDISDKNVSIIFCFIVMKLYETGKQLSSMFLLGIMKSFLIILFGIYIIILPTTSNYAH